MKKLTGFVIIFLLVAVLFLSIAVGYLLWKDAGSASGESIPSLTTSSVQTESSEVPESENSSESNAEAAESEAVESKTVETETAETEAEITGLRCSVQSGTLNIVEGEDFNISELNGSDYEAYTENGIYIVSGSTTHDNHIVITIPEDFQFETVELIVTGGALTAENINTQNLKTNCDQGVINYSGSVNVGAEVQQFQGKTVLNMDGKRTDYNYSLDLDLGHIGIDETQYAGPHQNQTILTMALKKQLMPAVQWGASASSFQKANGNERKGKTRAAEAALSLYLPDIYTSSNSASGFPLLSGKIPARNRPGSARYCISFP